MTGDSALRVLCTGDIHLGRHPTRIPAERDGVSFSPKTVWQAVVETAIQENVDAVLISGDIIDRETRYFEAFGPFEHGVGQLANADIQTLLVAGNHDFDSLPSLIDNLDTDSVTLLGEDGEWERATVTANGQTFHVDGWSFPHEHVHTSPMDQYDLPAVEEPLIGLIHGDFGNEGSAYAPLPRDRIASTPPEAWVLGHIHSPGVRLEADPFVFYPGSPQPLDPGEPGGHGAWLLEIEGESVSPERLYQATVRYDELTIDVAGLTDPKDLVGEIHDEVEDYVTSKVATQALELLLLRVRITGRSEIHGEFVQERAAIEEQLQFKIGALPVRVSKLEVDTKPAVDLEELAADETPAAYLAELLLGIDGEADPPDGYERLLDAASDAVQEAYLAPTYTPLRQKGRITDPDTDEVTTILEQQARLLLYELVEQQEVEP